ncbi:MAG: hypothetical protein ABSE49_19915 [Polyangiaceae bacterium]|jgi:hypothetical protein
MIAIPLGATRVDEALRVVKALGSHRYVAGRLHLVHAFAFAALPDPPPGLEEAHAWARGTLGRRDLDPASRDEALWRRSTDAEVVAVLDAFWGAGEASLATRRALDELLRRHELPLPAHAPFDEAAEDEMHPLLIDAGWELLPLAELDPQRHRGAMDAYGHALAFESARFEEETAIPPPTHLYELPALGPVELLQGADGEGALASDLVVWAEGDETYLDYIVRGVRRAAKLPERAEEG